MSSIARLDLVNRSLCRFISTFDFRVPGMIEEPKEERGSSESAAKAAGTCPCGGSGDQGDGCPGCTTGTRPLLAKLIAYICVDIR